jgi:hypothetical protein
MDLVDILFYMRKTEFTKLFSVVVLIVCLVCAVLFTEFVSASQFREPTLEDIEIQQQLGSGESPQVSEPLEKDLHVVLEKDNSFWLREYPWHVALSGMIFVAAVVFALLFGVVQKLFGV